VKRPRVDIKTQYQASGSLGWGATNVFWRQVRNLIIDMTAAPPTLLVAGIHWPTGQATSLQNIVFKMSTANGTQHQGLFIEEGSGGFVGDLVFYGGAQGLQVGNQCVPSLLLWTSLFSHVPLRGRKHALHTGQSQN
jgi:hypothetical protein